MTGIDNINLRYPSLYLSSTFALRLTVAEDSVVAGTSISATWFWSYGDPESFDVRLTSPTYDGPLIPVDNLYFESRGSVEVPVPYEG